MQAQALPESQPVYPATAGTREKRRAQPPAAARPASPGKAETPASTRRVGAHTSIAGGLTEALDLARRLRCTTLQIFSASPRMWTDGRQKIDPAHAAEFRERRRALGLDPVVIHANYLINLAAQNDDIYEKSVATLMNTVDVACAIEARSIVMMGHVTSQDCTT